MADRCVRTVAIAYVMQKTPYVFPIIGGRKVEHLYANLEALDIALSTEQITYLESILPFDKGFPYTQFVRIIFCSDDNLQRSRNNRVMAATTTGSSSPLDTSTSGLWHKLFGLRARAKIEAFGNDFKCSCR